MSVQSWGESRNRFVAWNRHDRGAVTIVEQQRCAPCRFHDCGATEVHTVPIPRSWSNRGAHRVDFTIAPHQFHDRGATEVRTDRYRADSTIVEQQRCLPCQFHNRGTTEVRNNDMNGLFLQHRMVCAMVQWLLICVGCKDV